MASVYDDEYLGSLVSDAPYRLGGEAGDSLEFSLLVPNWSGEHTVDLGGHETWRDVGHSMY